MKAKNAAKPAEKQKRARIDWEAVERDYRTAKFTLRELEAKHNVSYAEVSRKAKKEGWTKDLSSVIRNATNAALLEETTKKAQKDVTNTVLAAAELNKQVILKHRQDIEATRQVAFDLLTEVKESALLNEEKELLTQILAGEGAEPRDEAQARQVVNKALAFGNRVASVKALAETFVKLQDSERKAFGLEDADAKQETAKAEAAVTIEPGEAYKLMISR